MLEAEQRFVSRGGIKLENALEALGIEVEGRECLDVGASTGGFTDCMLQRGATRVAAVDVAYGQIDARLRKDPRVIVVERQNARSLAPADLPFLASLATIDVSFISLTKILPAVAACLAPGGEVLAMVKPQFELEKGRVGRGVVRDPADRQEAILKVALAAGEIGLHGPRLRLVAAAGPEGQPRDLRLVRGRRARGRGPRGRDRGRRRSRRRAPRRAKSEDRGADHPLPSAGGDRGGADRRRRGARRRLAAGRRPGRARQARRVARSGWSSSAPTRRPTSASSSAATARFFMRCVASPTRKCRCSASISARSASSRRSSAPTPRRGSPAPSPARPRSIELPALRVEANDRGGIGFNDVTLSRRPHDRVAELSYRIASEEVGHVRCDGLVAATPVGSTGYNLANQGPILAWGVKGYAVSYIAPHSLTARALVVAPADVLTVFNAPAARAGRNRPRRPGVRLPRIGRRPQGPLRRVRRTAGAAPRHELLRPHP